MFIYESQIITNIECNLYDKLAKVFQNYATKMGFDLKSIFFLYSGYSIQDSDYKLTVQEKITDSKTILVYKYDKNINSEQITNKEEINVLFVLDSDKIYKKKASWNTVIKNICDEYIENNSLNRKLIIFKYNDEKIDLNKKFIDIANNHDKDCRGITINVYSGHSLKIKFYYRNYKNEIDCILEDKVKDIFEYYSSIKYLNINRIEFYYREHLILLNSNLTFKQLINNDNDFSFMKQLITTEINFDEKFEIEIIVKKKTRTKIIPNKTQPHSQPESCCKNNIKKIIIIISSILVLLTVVFLILYFTVFKGNNKNKNITSIEIPNTCDNGYYLPVDDPTGKDCQKCSIEGCQTCNGTYENNECISCGDLRSVYQDSKIIKCDYLCETGDDEKCLTCDKTECKTCNLGYKLVDGKCKADYLIKIVYLTISSNEELSIFSLEDIYHIYNFFSQMIIDGEIVSPVRKYTFPEKGYHTVYYKLVQLGYATPVGYLFYGNDRIMSVSFLNFDDYIPRISFTGLFMSCTNLTSADLSKISFEMEYNYNLNEIFNDCINLKNVNFKINKFKVGPDVENMFYNCISLESIDLSALNFKSTQNYNYMFYNCKSLKYVNFQGLDPKSAVYMNSKFNKCISLKSIDLSMFKSNSLREMKNLFSNCISLIDVNLNGLYAHNVENMESLFSNCSSLKSISLTNLDTRNVEYLTNMFGHCYSLEYVDITKFDTSKVVDISSMFSHCSSLEYLNITNFVTNNVKDISSMFSHCYSLKSLDISNFVTNNVEDMNSMFSHCYSLTFININAEKFLTYQVIDMSYLFSHCYSLTTINISKFNTGKVRIFDSMFSHCYSLTSINILHFNTYAQHSMNSMFYGCYKLTSLDLSNVVNADFGDYNYLFYDCPNLHYVDVSNFLFDRMDDHDFFNTNISSNGTIRMRRIFHDHYISYYKYYLPPNWSVIYP